MIRDKNNRKKERKGKSGRIEKTIFLEERSTRELKKVEQSDKVGLSNNPRIMITVEHLC